MWWLHGPPSKDVQGPPRTSENLQGCAEIWYAGQKLIPSIHQHPFAFTDSQIGYAAPRPNFSAAVESRLEFAAELRTVNYSAVICPTKCSAVQASNTLHTRAAYRGVSRHRRGFRHRKSITLRCGWAAQTRDADCSIV